MDDILGDDDPDCIIIRDEYEDANSDQNNSGDSTSSPKSQGTPSEISYSSTALRRAEEEEDEDEDEDETDYYYGDKKTHKLPRALRELQFHNPGKNYTNFDPSKSRREEMKRKTVFGGKKRGGDGRRKMIYDYTGRLVEDGSDLCDCLNQQCPGCHFPCPHCGSEKCGVECRINRKWFFEQIEIEGAGVTLKFKGAGGNG